MANKTSSEPTDIYQKLSHRQNAIVFTALIALIAGVIYLSTDSGKRFLGFDPDATGSSASEGKFRKNERAVKDNYIVVFKDSVNDVEGKANELNGRHYGQLKHTYTSALKGFAAQMNEQQARLLSENPDVDYVEEDGIVEPQAVQSNATWGLARVDQREWLSNQNTEYEYNSTGQGVNVYVIDTGIALNHPDLQGRAFKGANTSGDNQGVEQCNPHGTHVAGTIGSATYGVAKNVKLYDVKVFGCWGGTDVSNVIAGIDWVARHHTKPAVANLSLSASSSSTLNRSVKSLISKGVTAVVAAGNAGSDACHESPANLPEAITVGGLDNRDYKANSSNYGSCVDLFAPGVGIESISGNINVPAYGYIMSGTSAATPHVTGVVALILQLAPNLSPVQIANQLINNSTEGLITGAGSGSPNRILYSLVSGSGSTPPEEPPPTTGCTNTYTGSIAGGSVVYHPTAGFSGRAGSYSGNLTSDTGAKLSLERKQGKNWTLAAQSPSMSTEEYLTFSGNKGTYRWKVEAINTTAYTLCANLP